MTRFWIWVLLNSGGAAAAYFGICKPETAIGGAYFTAIALLAHSLFGEDA